MGCYISDNDVLYAFNIWDVNSAKAIIDAASKLKRNVILQTSASIYEKIDIKAIRYFVTYYSKEKNIHAWLHLDHCKKMNIIDSAIINGYDSVMIDASNLPLYENIKITNEVVKKAHSKGVIVEAELEQKLFDEDGFQALCIEDNIYNSIKKMAESKIKLLDEV